MELEYNDKTNIACIRRKDLEDVKYFFYNVANNKSINCIIEVANNLSEDCYL